MHAADRLPDISIDGLLGPDGAASRCLPTFEDREAQRRMAHAVLEALEHGGVVAVEAPTGVGKTLAYLVAAVVSRRRVILSTHTKTLQDQLIDKDLPILGRLLAAVGRRLRRAEVDDGPPGGNETRYALMKGRSNYLCLSRLDRQVEQTSFSFAARGSLPIVRDWARTTARGDRAEIAGLAEDDPLWPEIDARSEICVGSRCPRFDPCFIGRMRREAQLADLIVVNHHLLLSDLALRAQRELAGVVGFGEVIPAAEALVLDEAHTLEAAASEHFGGRVSTWRVERLGRDVTRFMAEAGTSLDATAGAVELTRATTAVQGVFSTLPAAEGRFRFSSGAESKVMADSRRALPGAESALSTLAERLEGAVESDPRAQALVDRTKELSASLRFVLDAEDRSYVYWSERGRGGGSLGASPIEVSGLLREHLFERFGAVAMCSATLSAGDDGLRYFLGSVGAPAETEVVVLDSPYDFSRQAALYVPEDGRSPDASDADARLAREVEDLVLLVGGGALLLFTSHRMMRRVHDRLVDRLPYPVLLQGQQPKRETLRNFVEWSPAVLCGTATFWEGVDVPGEALQLVVIDRLPFDSPRDPLLAARAELLQQKGESPFSALQLPRAILRFKQGFGRLVRSRSDRGVVAILDGRVRTRGYGAKFTAALPAVPRVASVPELRRWWTDSV